MALDNSVHDKSGNSAQEREETAVAKPKEQAATRILKAMLYAGERDPAKIADYIRKHPGAQAEMFALLHASELGNRFVNKVTSILEIDDNASKADAGRTGMNKDLKAEVDAMDALPNAPKAAAVADAGQSADAESSPNYAPGGQFKPPKVDMEELVATGAAKAPGANSGEKESKPEATVAAPEGAPKAESVATAEPSKPAAPQAEEPKQEEAPKAAAPKVTEQKTEIASASQVQPQQKIDERELMDPSPESNEAESEEGGANEGAKQANGPMQVTASVLRVRTSPTTSSKNNIIGKLKRGELIKAVGTEGDWVKIEYKGQTAFVHGKYVTPSEPAAAETAQAAPSNDKPAIV